MSGTRLVIIGGSDAGISAALRARELDPTGTVTVIAHDQYPNFSICGIPFAVAGTVQPWHALAHRTAADLEATGMQLLLGATAQRIDVENTTILVRTADGRAISLPYDELVVATGARASCAGMRGLAGADALTAADGVHIVHTMDDLFGIERQLSERLPAAATIVGGGYVGLEMAEALTDRGVEVTLLQRGPEVLSGLDSDLGTLVRAVLIGHGIRVLTGAEAISVERSATGPRLEFNHQGRLCHLKAGIVIVAAGVTPETALLRNAGARIGAGGAVVVDEYMCTDLPHIFAAGDGVVTLHRLLGETYTPLGTTSHKQGRIAGENAVGGQAAFAGVLGTQVVKVFDVVAARTGLRDDEAAAAGFMPRSATVTVADHKTYIPGATPITIRVTGDAITGRLLGAQLVGRHGAEVAKRVDVFAGVLFHNAAVAELNALDLSYTPPLGSPWDAVQLAAQAWLEG